MGYSTFNVNKGAFKSRPMAGRFITIAIAAVFATSMYLSISASAAPETVVVTPTNMQGWSQGSTNLTGSTEFTEEFGAPADYGNGSLKLTTTDSSAKAQFVHGVPSGTTLAEINDIAYQTYRSADQSTGSDVQVAAVNVAIDKNGGTLEAGDFSTLVFEPVYQTSQGSIENDRWQEWDGGNESIWWSSNPVGGAPNRDTFVPLSTLKTENPDATVLGFGVNQGSGNPGIVSGVDAVTFGGVTYDFEVKAIAPSTKDECKNGGWETFATEYKNQGQCVASVQSSENSKHRR